LKVKIDIDCMDPAEARRLLPFRPHDQTSNQRLVYEQMVAPDNRDAFLATVKEYKDQGWEAILTRMVRRLHGPLPRARERIEYWPATKSQSALLCAKNIHNIQGRVLLQSSAFGAYDTDKVVAHARAYARELEREGVARDRFCIKIPCTGPALNASPILLREGIRTLGTSLFSLPQAVAASQAGCLSISPYYNCECLDFTKSNDGDGDDAAVSLVLCWCVPPPPCQVPWYHADASLWPDVQDPALQHPMTPRILHIIETYKRLHKETGKEQPMLKPARYEPYLPFAVPSPNHRQLGAAAGFGLKFRVRTQLQVG
jgi:transaldolase